MDLITKKKEKEELLQKVIQEIEARRESIEKLNQEILQLEEQGLIVQGAVLAIQEIMDESKETPTVEAEQVTE